MNDSMTVTAIKDFLQAAKPDNIHPVDLLIIVRHMLEHSQDHDINDSDLTLAKWFSCDTATINRSKKRLIELGWLAPARTRVNGRPLALSLNPEKLPLAQKGFVQPSKHAENFVTQYKRLLAARRGYKGHSPRWNRGWTRIQLNNAQQLITECGSYNEFAKRFNFAANHPRFEKTAWRGLYQLRRVWRKVTAEYDKQQQAQQPTAEGQNAAA